MPFFLGNLTRQNVAMISESHSASCKSGIRAVESLG